MNKALRKNPQLEIKITSLTHSNLHFSLDLHHNHSLKGQTYNSQNSQYILFQKLCILISLSIELPTYADRTRQINNIMAYQFDLVSRPEILYYTVRT